MTTINPIITNNPVAGSSAQLQQSSGGTGNADQVWNEYWNRGFNNPNVGVNFQDPNANAGYEAGRQEYFKRNPTTPTKTSVNIPINNNPTNNNPTGNEVNIPSGPSAEEIRQQQLAEIERSYNENAGLLNQQEQNVREMYPSQIQGVEDTYGLSKQKLSNTYDSTLNSLKNQDVSTKQGLEKMMDESRRLYNELSQGAQQRFGGASSAGEASKAILGQEFQRVAGSNKQTAANQLAEISQKRTDFQKEYELSLNQLDVEKASTLRDMEYKFRDSLFSIQSDKTKNEQMKRQESLQSLKEYASELSNVKARAQELQNSLALQRDKMETQFQYELGLINARASASSQYSEPAWKVSQYEDTPFFYNSQGQVQAINPNNIGVIDDNEDEESSFLSWLK